MFEFTVNVDDLLSVLKVVGNTIGKNTGNTNDDCIEMESTGTGVVFRTNNSIEYISATVIVGSCSPNGTKADLVSYDKFSKMISTLPAGQMITIKNDNNQFEIIVGKNKPIILNARSGIFLPLPTMTTQDIVTIPAQEFINAMTKVSSIIETTPTASIYECVRIATDMQDIDMSALDYNTKRMSSYTMKATSNNPKTEILIQGQKFAKHAKMFANAQDIDLAMDPGFVSIKVSNWLPNAANNVTDIEYYCRRYSGSFPNNITQKLSDGFDSCAEVSKEELMCVLSRIQIIEDKSIAPARVKIHAKGDEMNASYNTTFGSVNEDISLVQVAKGEINAEFNLSNMIEIINGITTSNLQIGKIKAQKGTSYYLIKPDANSNLKFGMSSLVANTP